MPVQEGGAFLTTHWSVVLGAYQTDPVLAGAALERLCRIPRWEGSQNI
ncbi:MAG TPA: hypothetical protein VNU68_22360 [Verrucomicrobiae bacterium]|nr:hypothetical protein [Verrucomicrobiae bacterium]